MLTYLGAIDKGWSYGGDDVVAVYQSTIFWGSWEANSQTNEHQRRAHRPNCLPA